MRELTENEIALFDNAGQIPALQKSGTRVGTAHTARRNANTTARTAVNPTREPRWARASRRGGALPA